MAGKEIKTTIKIDGERKFQEAISASKQEVKVLGSELKAAAADYQLSGDKMDYLSKRTDVLTREIAEQEKVIRQTSEYLAKAAAGGEQYSSKVNRLKIELNNSEAALSRMRKELQDADRELEELGRDSLTAGRNIERGLTDAAEEASKSVEDMVSEMNANIGSLNLKSSISFAANLAQGAVQFVQGVDQWATATLDYNRKVGMLKTNVEMSGADWDVVEAQFLEVAALTGDADSAIETLSNLLAAGVTDSKALDEMVGLLAGAVIQFPDTLKFESLADSLQETLAKQEATGQFAELLERLGVDVEAFNTALQTTEGTAGDLDLIMGVLANNGLMDVYNTYLDINGGITDAAKAEERLNGEIQALGGHVAEWFAPAKEAVAGILADINDAIEQGKSLNQIVFGEKVPEPASVGEMASSAAEGMGKLLAGEYENEETKKAMRDTIGAIVSIEAEKFSNNYEALNDEVIAAQDNWWDNARKWYEEKFLSEGKTLWKINNFFSMGETPEAHAPAGVVNPPTSEEYQAAWEAAMQQYGITPTVEIPAEVNTDEALEGMSSALDDYAKAASGYGEKIGEGVGDGIIDGLRASERGLARQMARINRILGSGGSGAGTGTTGTGGASELLANLQIDGKTFARMVVPYIDREQGKQWKTTVST